MQPVDACRTPRDSTFWMWLIRQKGDGPTRPHELFLILGTNAG
jgi:hypothetical protein